MPKYLENYKISYARLLIPKEVVEVFWKLGVSESGNFKNLFSNKLLPPRTKSQIINTPCLLSLSLSLFTECFLNKLF